jgi:hypothetical protein
MDVTFVKEHEDGSATFTFEMTSEEHKIMVTLGIITALKAGIEEGKQYVNNTNMVNPECVTPDSSATQKEHREIAD